MLSNIPKARIAVTRQCNMGCIYCPRGPDLSMENYDGDKYCMSNEEIIAIAETLYGAGIRNIHLTGGEPLLRPGLVDLVAEIKKIGAVIELNTNGLALTREMAQDLASAGVGLLKISLDSPTEEHFRKLTKVDGYETVVTNIKTAIPILPVRLNSVVLQQNKSLIPDLIDLADEIGAPTYHLLDLTYYPAMEYRDFWQKEFVNLTEEIAPVLADKFKEPWQPMEIFGCNFSKIDRGDGKCVIVIKEADMSMRSTVCNDCQSYCHEGVFTLRISAGGYLNICPASNYMGVDAREMIQSGKADDLKSALEGYLAIFQRARPTDSFEAFLRRNSLSLTGA